MAISWGSWVGSGSSRRFRIGVTMSVSYTSTKATVTRKIYCAFPQEIIQEPLLYSIATQFSVVPNIRGASVREDEATMDLELEGDEQAIESVIEYLRKRGITVNE